MQYRAKIMSECFLTNGVAGTRTNLTCRSYEALPPNYGLGHNMMAGAFAGIAVWSQARLCTTGRLTASSGAHRDVPSGLDEGIACHECCNLWRRWLIDPRRQTRMQIINPSAGGLYTGLSHAVSTIYRIEGIRTLWRGMTSVIVGAGTLLC